MADLSKLNFLSSVNYMKRDVSSGTATLTLGAFGSKVTQTVTHSLGYIPLFQVLAEQDNTGTIWYPSIVDQYTESSISGVQPTNPEIEAWTTTTTLTITVVNNTTPTASGSVVIYWLIYKDYGNV